MAAASPYVFLDSKLATKPLDHLRTKWPSDGQEGDLDTRIDCIELHEMVKE